MVILPNGVAVIAGDTHHAQWCATEGLVHDKWMAQQITQVILQRGVKLCVDGGANIGTLTKPMLEAGCLVVAFEPNPEAAACLRHNCPSLGCAVHEVGLSDSSAQMVLLPCPNAGARHISRTAPISAMPGEVLLTQAPPNPVMVAPLDGYGLNPGLIKLDVEGFEVFALQGARKTIKRHRPAIIAEVNAAALGRNNHTPHCLFDEFRKMGYRYKIMQPDCHFGDPQYDVLALPF